MRDFFTKLYQNTFEDFVLLLEENIKKNIKTFVVTANPETFMIAEKETEFANLILDEKTTVVPDGIGIVKTAQMLHYSVSERISGIDLAYELLRIGNENKKSIYLLGASEEVKEKMVEKIKNEYPNLHLKGAVNGFGSNKDKEFNKIKKLKPDIILVALGIPAQEKLIYKHLDDFEKGIFIGVGGSFDVISGNKKRAPKMFQKLGIEWLYRLLKEPKRIKRFYHNNVKFVFKIRKIKKVR
ncbi:MAG: WecB/TagA/CpsF family glycosyltransferase [Bacilli bacterium]|nr:WecB/TagA/CpsF family glycosyltransferase [Bacilli bacterium]